VEQALRVSVYGATGYTASELFRALLHHPQVKVVNLISSSSAGKSLREVFPHLEQLGDKRLVSEPEEDYDLAFLCLPHEVSMELVPELISQGKKVIDLSGAYRIKNKEAYPEFYGFEHLRPELLEEAVYGLSEVFREDLKEARLIANPGCYPTASLLALYPLIREGIEIESVYIHALSGVSGAGRKAKQQFHYPEMEENFFAYSVEKHRHTPEMEDVLKRVYGKEIRLRFTPVVVPASRGMLSTLYIRTDFSAVKELYREVYKEEPFIRVIDKPPMSKWVLGTNLCLIYPTYDERTSTAVVISAIDNLGKGASLQAVQNMNISYGFEEDLGIPKTPIFP
jgi:N-acetyl-gamma-glutamyl-phosphate reductase